MATAFRDWPWPLQALFYVGLGGRSDRWLDFTFPVCLWQTVRDAA